MQISRVLLVSSRFRVVEKKYEHGGRSHVREVVEHPGAAAIVPLLPEERVCLVRNFRPAIEATLLEIPAGTLEPNETPLETARRELAEETGYLAASLHELQAFYMSPGILRERMHLFVAENLQLGSTRLDEGEIVESEIVGWKEAMKMVADGTIQDAKTIAGLLLTDAWKKNRPR